MEPSNKRLSKKSAGIIGDGEAIYYPHQNGMRTDLMKIKISSSAGTQIGEQQILQNGLHSTGFTISRDTKKLAYTKIENYSNLWSATVVGEGESQQISTAKLTHGTSRHMWPAFSPDGNKISFISQQQVFVMNSDGGNIHQLTFLQSECKVPCWSPDGNELAFIADEKVWQIPTEGGKPSQFKETDVIRELSWSPGNKILYLRPENQNYHLLDPQTGSEMPLVSNDSVGFMIHARRSPDGKNVAVVWQRVDGQYLWIISMEDSSQIRIQNQDPWTTLAPLQWSADGKWIYLVRSGKPQLDILTLSVNGGEPQRIFTLPFESLYSENGLGPDAISLTPDGSRFVCSVRESISDIWMIDNFDPEIE
jgi:Tol biopolymer transport system component